MKHSGLAPGQPNMSNRTRHKEGEMKEMSGLKKVGCGCLTTVIAFIIVGAIWWARSEWIEAGYVGIIYNANGGIDHDRLHRGHVLQRLVNPHGVENAKCLFADFVAAPGSSSEHLIKENATVHATEENEVADRGHVDPCCQEVDRDCHIGMSFVLTPAAIACERRLIDRAPPVPYPHSKE